MLDALIYLFVAALGCCGIWFFGFQRKERDWERISVLSLSLSLFLVLALRWGVEFRRDSWDWVFTGIQTVFDVLEGNSEEFRNALSALPMVPELLSCAVPALTVFTAAQLLWNYLPHHVPMGKQEWLLFSNLDANSVRMAKKLTHADSLCIFLRTRRSRADTDLLKELSQIHFFLYPGDEGRFLLWPWRRKKLLRFFFLSENTEENFQRMQDFLTAAGKKKLFKPRNVSLPDGHFQQELYLLSETESASMLIEHLREILKTSRCFRNTELRLLDRFRATSYDLLRTKPLYEHIHDGKLHILILGFGRIGREFFRAACSLGILHGCNTEFTLCDLAINKKLNTFLSQCPELHRSVTFRSMELDAESDQLDHLIRGQQFSYILVALGDDERNIRVTSLLNVHYRRLHWVYRMQKAAWPQTVPQIHPQICVNIEDPIKHTYTEGLWDADRARGHALHVFGGLEQVFTPEVLMPRSLWNAARYIHRQLNDLGGDAAPDWGEYERRSSIACALRAAYLDASRPSGASPEALADTEHLRWMAYVRSEGLRQANIALMNTYYGKVKGGHVDILGKLTPCLTEDRKKLEDVWTYLTTGSHAGNYIGKKSFRERDLYLVDHAHEIAEKLKN